MPRPRGASAHEGAKPGNSDIRPLKRLLSVSEAAVYLGMTQWGVRGLIYNGKIPSVRNGRRVFLDIEDMNRWIEENKEQVDLM
jgi:excisionase family DNA binding protein